MFTNANTASSNTVNQAPVQITQVKTSCIWTQARETLHESTSKCQTGKKPWRQQSVQKRRMFTGAVSLWSRAVTSFFCFHDKAAKIIRKTFKCDLRVCACLWQQVAGHMAMGGGGAAAACVKGAPLRATRKQSSGGMETALRWVLVRKLRPPLTRTTFAKTSIHTTRAQTLWSFDSVHTRHDLSQRLRLILQLRHFLEGNAKWQGRGQSTGTQCVTEIRIRHGFTQPISAEMSVYEKNKGYAVFTLKPHAQMIWFTGPTEALKADSPDTQTCCGWTRQ